MLLQSRTISVIMPLRTVVVNPNHETERSIPHRPALVIMSTVRADLK